MFFWGPLKLELVYRDIFATRKQANADLFDFIELFYNRKRHHTALGCHSPALFQAKTPNKNHSFLCPFFEGSPDVDFGIMRTRSAAFS
jgi:hypothetical protein